MKLNKIMTKQIIKMGTNVKLIHGKVIGNISPIMEWTKWLSYEPEFEKKRNDWLNMKKISECSYEELVEASRYSRNRTFATLFKIYGTKECSEENYMRVYNYMCDESIEKLMISKLTPEELQYAEQEITRLRKIPKEHLKTKVKEEQTPEKYEQLSMVDSYILHVISDINYERSISNLTRETEAQLNQNDMMRQKSLYYASTPYTKK